MPSGVGCWPSGATFPAELPVQPKISVLLPAFNAAQTLSAALQSVVRQTESDWECVVVDDGSSDHTLAKAEMFAARDGRIRVVSGSHSGLVVSLKKGLLQCRGTLIARMDADDVMHRDRLLLQAQALESDATLAMVGCQVRLFPRGRLTEGRMAYERWLNSLTTGEMLVNDAYVECPLAHPTWMIRSEVLRRFSYRDRGWPEDYDLLLRLLEAGERIGSVPRRLLLWRDAGSRLSRNSDTYSQRRIVECKAEHLCEGFLRSCRDYLLWGYGDTGKALSRALRVRGRRPIIIAELHPRRIGQRIDGALVIPRDQVLAYRGLPIVVSVAGAVARRKIRGLLSRMGFCERRDYVVAA